MIAYDGEQQPPYSMGDFTPSTVPGCRTPHFWLRTAARSTTRWAPTTPCCASTRRSTCRPLQAAAAERGVPLQLARRRRRAKPRAPYREKLVLSRPDQHVAWRGDALPADPPALIARVTGVVS